MHIKKSPRTACIFFVLMGLLPMGSAKALNQALKSSDTFPTCVTTGSDAGYQFKPQCEERLMRAGRMVTMKYNSQGLRDKDYDSKPSAGWQRILFLGPSLLAGPGLEEAQTPPRALEKYLRKRIRKLEVINGGVEGYMSTNTSARAAEWVRAYNPTHTLLLFSPNTLNIDIFNEPFIKWQQDGRPTFFEMIPAWTFTLLKFLGTKQWEPDSYAKARTLLSFSHRAKRLLSCKWRQWRGDDLIPCLFDTSLKAILASKRAAEARGSKFILVISPYANADQTTRLDSVGPPFYLPWAEKINSLSLESSYRASDLAAWLEKNGIQIQRFPFPSNRELYLPNDYHLSAAGSQVFGENLANDLAPFLEAPADRSKKRR